MDSTSLVRGLWEQMDSTLKSAVHTIEAKDREERAERPNLELRAEGLTKLKEILVKEKDAVVDKFRAAGATHPPSVTADMENAFWARVGELDSAIQRASDELDDIKQELFFPPSQGFKYSFGSNGVYVGMHDFWVDSLAGHLALDIKHAQKTTVCTRGQSQVHVLPPVVSISITNFHVNLRCDGLFLKGERGSKVPDMKVQLLDITVDLAFEMVVEWNPRANRWNVKDGFRFEVVHLDRHQIGSIKMPKKLLRWIINWVAPVAIKKLAVKAIPPELGKMLMATRQQASFEADFRLTSIPLIELDAPLEAAADATPPVSEGSSAYSSGSPHSLSSADIIAEAKTTLKRGVVDLAMPATAARAAAWLGLTPTQARALIHVQRFPGGTREPMFRSIFELMRVIAKFAECGTQWKQFLTLFQKLFDEYQNVGLLRASFEASNCPDYAKRSEILNNAKSLLQAASVDISGIMNAAIALRKKPVRIDFEVTSVNVDIVVQSVVKCLVRSWQQYITQKQSATIQSTTHKHTHVPVPVSAGPGAFPPPLPVLPSPDIAIGAPPSKRAEVSLAVQLKELEGWEQEIVSMVNDIQTVYTNIESEMKVNVSGGSAGTITIQLSDVAYTCPPGVGIPVSLRNSVMEPAQYWLGFGTEEDGALSVEVLVTPPDGSTPHRPPVVVHSPKPPPRRQVLTSVVSPDAMALDHGDGQPHSPQRYTEVIGDADGHEDDEDADSAQPPVIDTKQNLPPLDSLVQLSLLGVQSGLRVDVKALTEAALSESNTSMLDVMQVRCAPAPNPVDGHLISVDIPKWAFWWMQAQRIQATGLVPILLRQVLSALRGIADAAHVGPPVPHHHDTATSSSATIVSSARKYLLDDHLRLDFSVALTVTRSPMAALCTPFVAQPAHSTATVTRIHVANVGTKPSGDANNSAKVSATAPAPAPAPPEAPISSTDPTNALIQRPDGQDVPVGTAAESAPQTGVATIPASVDLQPAVAATSAAPQDSSHSRQASDESTVSTAGQPVPPPRRVKVDVESVPVMSLSSFLDKPLPSTPAGPSAPSTLPQPPLQSSSAGAADPAVAPPPQPPVHKTTSISNTKAQGEVSKNSSGRVSAIVFGVQFSLLELLEDVDAVAAAWDKLTNAGSSTITPVPND